MPSVRPSRSPLILLWIILGSLPGPLFAFGAPPESEKRAVTPGAGLALIEQNFGALGVRLGESVEDFQGLTLVAYDGKEQTFVADGASFRWHGIPVDQARFDFRDGTLYAMEFSFNSSSLTRRARDMAKLELGEKEPLPGEFEKNIREDLEEEPAQKMIQRWKTGRVLVEFEYWDDNSGSALRLTDLSRFEQRQAEQQAQSEEARKLMGESILSMDMPVGVGATPTERIMGRFPSDIADPSLPGEAGDQATAPVTADPPLPGEEQTEDRGVLFGEAD